MVDNKTDNKKPENEKTKSEKDEDGIQNLLNERDIELLRLYNRGMYSESIKKLEKELKELSQNISETKGVKESDTGLSQPNLWDLTSDRNLLQKEQPLQVARCTKIIDSQSPKAKYVVSMTHIGKYVVELGNRVSPTDIEEGMRVG
ncbi:26S proteasome regulatory subunit 7A [Bonamia ostreae]|uniref:26S proteasome regulatory subunit 7A n=1 Tax=Bonamia ostreae TaxID=126728 RepID=A0ABV2APP0_9EUKA